MFLVSPVGTRRAASGASLAFALAAYNRILQLPSLCSIYQGRCRSCYQNVNKAESFHIQQSERQLSKPMMSRFKSQCFQINIIVPYCTCAFCFFLMWRLYTCIHFNQSLCDQYYLAFYFSVWLDRLRLAQKMERSDFICKIFYYVESLRNTLGSVSSAIEIMGKTEHF